MKTITEYLIPDINDVDDSNFVIKCKSKDHWNCAIYRIKSKYGSLRYMLVSKFEDLNEFKENFSSVRPKSRQYSSLWNAIETIFNKDHSEYKAETIVLTHYNIDTTNKNGRWKIETLQDNDCIYESIIHLRYDLDETVTPTYYSSITWKEIAKRLKIS